MYPSRHSCPSTTQGEKARDSGKARRRREREASTYYKSRYCAKPLNPGDRVLPLNRRQWSPVATAQRCRSWVIYCVDRKWTATEKSASTQACPGYSDSELLHFMMTRLSTSATSATEAVPLQPNTTPRSGRVVKPLAWLY